MTQPSRPPDTTPSIHVCKEVTVQYLTHMLTRYDANETKDEDEDEDEDEDDGNANATEDEDNGNGDVETHFRIFINTCSTCSACPK